MSHTKRVERLGAALQYIYRFAEEYDLNPITKARIRSAGMRIRHDIGSVDFDGIAGKRMSDEALRGFQ